MNCSVTREINIIYTLNYSKPSNQNTVSLPPWKQVSSGVTWNNENPDLNCTICFDIMEKKSSVNLRCQHMFHREVNLFFCLVRLQNKDIYYYTSFAVY